MTVFVFGSAKGSPGVTTAVVALAARWPSRREPVIVEADVSGGDLVAWLAPPDGGGDGLADTPSTVQLCASARSGLSDRVLLEHLQRLPGRGEVRVLVAPSSPFAASTAMAGLVAAGIAGQLAAMAGVDVLVDVGRVDATSPNLVLLRTLGRVVLAVRPTVADVVHTRDLVESLRAVGVACSLLVIGDRPYSPAEVTNAVGADGLVGVLPDDPVGARAICGDARNAKVLGRTRLVRAAAQVAARLAPAPVPAVPVAVVVPAATPILVGRSGLAEAASDASAVWVAP